MTSSSALIILRCTCVLHIRNRAKGVEKLKLGYQTVRWGWGCAAEIFPQVLDEISAAGFRAFEANDGDVIPFLDDERGFSRMLSERKIQMVGIVASDIGSLLLSSSSRYFCLRRIKKLMRFASIVGCEKFVLGGPIHAAARQEINEKLYATYSKTLNKIGKECIDLNMNASYHPHIDSIGTTIAQLDKLLKLTDPSLMNLALDTGHFSVAGIDSLEVIKKYPNRIDLVHIKDVMGGKFVELGEGTDIDIPSIMKSLNVIGYKGWVIVEDEVLDMPPPLSIIGRTSRLPLETAKRSKKYIDRLMKSDIIV